MSPQIQDSGFKNQEDPPPRLISYQGPRLWLISACVSCFGTTSLLLSVATLQIGKPDQALVPSLFYPFLMFYLVALLFGFIGGFALLISWEFTQADLRIRGKRVSDRTLKWSLLVCYTMPWFLLAGFFLLPLILR